MNSPKVEGWAYSVERECMGAAAPKVQRATASEVPHLSSSPASDRWSPPRSSSSGHTPTESELRPPLPCVQASHSSRPHARYCLNHRGDHQLTSVRAAFVELTDRLNAIPLMEDYCRRVVAGPGRVRALGPGSWSDARAPCLMHVPLWSAHTSISTPTTLRAYLGKMEW